MSSVLLGALRASGILVVEVLGFRVQGLGLALRKAFRVEGITD